jgi:hypothetical protein
VCVGVRARLIVHARKAYGPWRACASVCLLARVCCVCVCAALHCTMLFCTVLCKCCFLCTRRVRRVHCARDVRAWCECTSARSRNPGCGKMFGAAMGFTILPLEGQRQVSKTLETLKTLTKTLM